jgi:phospholipid/cholesterol/gamma-HCH transport system substrate-binding protein
MIKEAPSVARIAAMVGFTLSCVVLLMWLWLQFGGPTPLNPQGYRFKASFDEAALLVEQADVRIAGLDVGKVVDKQLDEKSGRTIATVELEEKYAPIPRNTKVILRQKALLGETYIELSTGNAKGPALHDDQMLPRPAAQESVQIDEIIRTFDKPTRRNFQSWMRELATAIDKGRGEHLNDALGTLPDFVASGDDVLEVLDEQEPALRGLIRNSGRALAAVNRRDNEFQQLIVNANNFFGALASRNDALAETVFILPTFLAESRTTLLRLRRFAIDTRPLVRDLKPVARDLPPTLRSVRRFAPHLKRLFRNLDPLIKESRRNLPAASRFIRGAEPVFVSLHAYLPELNPILSFANYQQAQLADFISGGGAAINATLPPITSAEGPRHYLRSLSAIGARSSGLQRTRPSYERANAYPAPNYLARASQLGIAESFDCSPDVRPDKRQPTQGEPPCYVQPQQLFDGRQFPRLERGGAPIRQPPPGALGATPANP